MHPTSTVTTAMPATAMPTTAMQESAGEPDVANPSVSWPNDSRITVRALTADGRPEERHRNVSRISKEAAKARITVAGVKIDENSCRTQKSTYKHPRFVRMLSPSPMINPAKDLSRRRLSHKSIVPNCFCYGCT